MSWTPILALAAASYALKALGPVVVGAREIPAPVRALLDLAAVPLLAALVVVQTVSTGGAFAIDARLPALGVAVVLIVTLGRRPAPLSLPPLEQLRTQELTILREAVTTAELARR